MRQFDDFHSKAPGLFPMRGYTFYAFLSSISTNTFHLILNYCVTLMAIQSILITHEARGRIKTHILKATVQIRS